MTQRSNTTTYYTNILCDILCKFGIELISTRCERKHKNTSIGHDVTPSTKPTANQRGLIPFRKVEKLDKNDIWKAQQIPCEHPVSFLKDVICVELAFHFYAVVTEEFRRFFEIFYTISMHR